MVGLAGKPQPPPAVGPDVGADADRLAQVDQSAALFDVQLDEGADPAQRFGIRPDLVGTPTGAASAVGHADAVAVGQAERPVGRHAPR